MKIKKESIALFLAALALGVYALTGAERSAYAADEGDVRLKYFDPHNHLNGILPYEAYADLPAYIKKLEGEGKGVTDEDKENFYTYVQKTWYPPVEQKLDNKPYSPDTRSGLGARATVAVYPNGDDPVLVAGALERVLAATPYTEYDSGYAMRGDPGETYLKKEYYDGNDARLAADLCKATVLELATTGITVSEQSMNFIGGWKLKNGQSARLNVVKCYGTEPQALATTLERLGKAVPTIRILLMTASAELGQKRKDDKDYYSSFAADGTCQDVPLSDAARTSPAALENGLLGREADGKPVISKDDEERFFSTVVGIDTAGPEVTCFSEAGMTQYKRMIDAVYSAAKRRREMGWQGKLLVHTHAGEGFTVYYGRRQPAEPWTFPGVFGALPGDDDQISVSNERQAHDNIGMALAAIAEEEEAHKDIHQYVVFRLGHVTWADQPQADSMAHEEVEADVNLDSNLATNAYPILRMPASAQVRQKVETVIGDQKSNLQLNNFPHFVIGNAANVDETGEVLGNSSLKYLLMAHVRVMLGTDGAGVEFSDIAREYVLGESLIKYWDGNDPVFREKAGDIDAQHYYDDVNWHLDNMSTNTYLPYR